MVRLDYLYTWTIYTFLCLAVRGPSILPLTVAGPMIMMSISGQGIDHNPDKPSLLVRDEPDADPRLTFTLNVWPRAIRHVGNCVDLPTIDTNCLAGAYQDL
ncbi:hypothetical protein N7474_009272 [Penicillium riverlandense]|uniref:uncharacterized protein n=1 Tax=Penicillium riverlandense TaxID=1903569 RepID=UPI002547BFAA|nr:uncharacterized protein N7474_009272 [Penicillium riverlandense]KAJ5808003.1 hypothetical protein N7474_009272 [Penicillium riverlandense]